MCNVSLSVCLNRSLLLGVLFTLAACGSSSDNKTPLSSTIDINVAAQSSGGNASTSYVGSDAGVVNDGNTNIAESWAGNVTNDWVQIEFDGVKNISRITVYTNEEVFSSTDPAKLIELSLDGSVWQTTAQPPGTGAVIPCVSTVISANKIDCTLATRTNARFIRFTVLAPSDVGLVQVYEIQVLGRPLL